VVTARLRVSSGVGGCEAEYAHSPRASWRGSCTGIGTAKKHKSSIEERVSGGSGASGTSGTAELFVFGFVTGEPQCLLVDFGEREPVDGLVLVLVLVLHLLHWHRWLFGS
jgi:hypothetical protein